MREFEFIRPTTLDACYSSLEEFASEAAVLAGGTDLVVAMQAGSKRPRYVVDIKKLPDTRPFIRQADSMLTVGTCSSMHALKTGLPPEFRALSEAAGVVGARQIRNRATLGGNIMQASPSAETVPPLVVFGAEVELWSRDKRRRVPIDTFFLGPHLTAAEPGELLHNIRMSFPSPNTGIAYMRFTPRKAMDIAVVNVAVSLTGGGSGACEECRIALGAVGPTVIRAVRAENTLRGERITPHLLALAGREASMEAQPIDDMRASAQYRRELINILVQRTGAEALARQSAQAPL